MESSSAIYYGNAGSLIVNATNADVDWIADSNNAANSSFMNLADTAKKEGAGVYQLFLIIGIVGVMCFGTWLGLLTTVSKNSNKREENKTQFIYPSSNAINSFTRRAEARLHDLAVEIESRYPGDSQKQQEEFRKQMVPVAREELRSCVIREALSSRHAMINKGYLEKSEVYQDIEDGIMEEYFRVQSLNNINGYLQNGDE